MKSQHFMFFAKPTERWWKVQICISRRRCEFDVAAMLYRRCGEFEMKVNFLSNVEATFVQRGDLTSQYQRWEDVVNFTLPFQRCSNVVITTFILRHELDLLSNVETTLEQPGKFDFGV